MMTGKRRFLLLVLFQLLTTIIYAQTGYRGTFHYDTLRQESITCIYEVNSATQATITIQHVKFSPRMPVRVDVTIPAVNVSHEQGVTILKGDHIIPLSGHKARPKRTVYNFYGTIKGNQLSFRFLMNKKIVTYNGTLHR